MTIPVGQRFGNYTVLGEGPRDVRKVLRWRVRCDCGATRTVYPNNVRHKNQRWCDKCRPTEPTNKKHSYCTLEGCKNRHNARGYCQLHYRRFLHGTDLHNPVGRVRPQCTWEGCERPNYTHHLCSLHYTRKIRGYPMNAPLRMTREGQCSAPECTKDVAARGMCKTHYQRVLRAAKKAQA